MIMTSAFISKYAKSHFAVSIAQLSAIIIDRHHFRFILYFKFHNSLA